MGIDEALREVFKAHREASSKHTYFLLAAAGAGIGLAVNQTQGLPLCWSQTVLALAVASWGASFFAGCRHVDYVSSSLFANADLIRVEAGRHPKVGAHPEYMEAASEGIRDALSSNSDHAERWGSLQFRLLIAGAGFFVAWHVLEMYLRRANAPRLL